MGEAARFRKARHAPDGTPHDRLSNGVTHRRILAAALLLVSAGVRGEKAPSLSVAAAANLRPALEEIRVQFERSTGIGVAISYDASGTLARRIIEGAAFDAFLSADASFLPAEAIDADSRTSFALGTLALAVAKGRPAAKSVESLGDPRYARIAIAKPELAPYGRAAMQALERAGALSRVRARLVFADSVDDALKRVETGDADAAFVAVSEARRTSLSWIEVPPGLYVPIRQEAAVIARSPNRAAARRFVDFLRSPESRAILIAQGYGVP